MMEGIDQARERTISTIAKRHHAWTGKWGWHESTTLLEKVGLIHTEVAEAQEELRLPVLNRERFALELADVVLRTCDASESAGVDLEQAILDKLAKNQSRDLTHKVK